MLQFVWLLYFHYLPVTFGLIITWCKAWFSVIGVRSTVHVHTYVYMFKCTCMYMYMYICTVGIFYLTAI